MSEPGSLPPLTKKHLDEATATPSYAITQLKGKVITVDLLKKVIDDQKIDDDEKYVMAQLELLADLQVYYGDPYLNIVEQFITVIRDGNRWRSCMTASKLSTYLKIYQKQLNARVEIGAQIAQYKRKIVEHWGDGIAPFFFNEEKPTIFWYALVEDLAKATHGLPEYAVLLMNQVFVYRLVTLQKGTRGFLAHRDWIAPDLKAATKQAKDRQRVANVHDKTLAKLRLTRLFRNIITRDDRPTVQFSRLESDTTQRIPTPAYAPQPPPDPPQPPPDPPQPPPDPPQPPPDPPQPPPDPPQSQGKRSLKQRQKKDDANNESNEKNKRQKLRHQQALVKKTDGTTGRENPDEEPSSPAIVQPTGNAESDTAGSEAASVPLSQARLEIQDTSLLYKFPAVTPSVFDYQFNAADVLACFFPKVHERFIQNKTYPVVGTGIFKWWLTTDLPNQGELLEPVKTLLDVFQLEFELYRWHAKRGAGDQVHWCHLMLYSMAQQVARQYPPLYALVSSLREDNAVPLVTFPCASIYTEPGDAGGHFIQGAWNRSSFNRDYMRTAMISMDYEDETTGCRIPLGNQANLCGYLDMVSGSDLTPNFDEAKACGVRWARTVLYPGCVRVTPTTLPEMTPLSPTSVKRLIPIIYVGINRDHESTENANFGTWSEIANAHRAGLAPEVPPNTIAWDKGVATHAFPTVSQVDGLSPLSDALVGRRKWTEFAVIDEVQLLLGNPRRWRETEMEKWQQTCTQKVVALFNSMVLAEKHAYGSNSFFANRELARCRSKPRMAERTDQTVDNQGEGGVIEQAAERPAKQPAEQVVEGGAEQPANQTDKENSSVVHHVPIAEQPDEDFAPTGTSTDIETTG